MLREEAIDQLEWYFEEDNGISADLVTKQAFNTIKKALSQEPKADKPMCDRNICLSNEYNGIGCDECIVNKAEQEPCTDAVSQKENSL